MKNKFWAIPNWDHCPQPNTDMKKIGIVLVDPVIQESKKSSKNNRISRNVDFLKG